jgi:hypothetical protein
MAAVTGVGSPMTARNGAMPVRCSASRVLAYFDILGIKPALGRTFVAGEASGDMTTSSVTCCGHRNLDPIPRSSAIDTPERGTLHGHRRHAGGSAFDRGWTEVWLPLSFGPDKMSRNSHWLFSRWPF